MKFQNLFLVSVLISAMIFLGCSSGAGPYTDSVNLESQDNLSLVSGARTVNPITVKNIEELISALESAQAGDCISLAPGVYTTDTSVGAFDNGSGGTVNRSWYFRGAADGSSDKPIILQSQDSEDPAVLSGSGWDKTGYGLYITGDYWIIKNIVVKSAAKGVIFDNSNYSQLEGVEIYDIGQEGLHVRDGSCNLVIDGINLHDVGKKNDGFGEGVYVGSDNSVWAEGDGEDTGEKGLYYSREVHNTVVKNSIIGPNITAEPFDIKEGTTGTIIENNHIHGQGISGQNYADSHIDLKGCWAVVRYNIFYQDGNDKIKRGIMVVPRINAGVDAEFTAQNNYVHDNTFNLESAVKMVVSNSGSVNTYAWNNSKVPNEGSRYDSRVIQSIPSGYDPGDEPTVDPDPEDPIDDPVVDPEDPEDPIDDPVVDPEDPEDPIDDPVVDPEDPEDPIDDPVVDLEVNPTESLLSIQYEPAETDLDSKYIKADLLIVNTGDVEESLDGYSLRYWFTKDELTPVYLERYVSFGSENAEGDFGSGNGMDYCEITFVGGVVNSMDDEKIKVTIKDANYSRFNQADDYSFDSDISSFTEYTKITLYKNNELIWGVEP